MRKKNFTVGIVGLGTTGKEHLKYYNKNKDVNKIYVSEKKKIKSEKRIILDKNLSKFNKINSKKIISISNYDKDHAKFIKKFYKTSNVFVEKPMCTKLIDAKKIFKMIKKYKFRNLIYSNLVLRSSPLLNSILYKIYKGDFGKIYYFEGDYLYGRLDKIRYGWRGKDKNYSVLLGGGIHLIDLMISFFNQKPEFVQSYSSNFFLKRKNRIQDFSQSNFFFKNGGLGKITANFGCVHNHQHVLKIYGTKKTFLYDDMGARIFSKRDPYKGTIIKKKTKLYENKSCLLPKFFSKINSRESKKEHILKEFDLIASCLYADQSSKKKGKKIKIRYFR